MPEFIYIAISVLVLLWIVSRKFYIKQSKNKITIEIEKKAYIDDMTTNEIINHLQYKRPEEFNGELLSIKHSKESSLLLEKYPSRKLDFIYEDINVSTLCEAEISLIPSNIECNRMNLMKEIEDLIKNNFNHEMSRNDLAKMIEIKLKEKFETLKFIKVTVYIKNN